MFGDLRLWVRVFGPTSAAGTRPSFSRRVAPLCGDRVFFSERLAGAADTAERMSLAQDSSSLGSDDDELGPPPPPPRSVVQLPDTAAGTTAPTDAAATAEVDKVRLAFARFCHQPTSLPSNVDEEDIGVVVCER